MKLLSRRYNEIEREVIMLFGRITVDKFPLDCYDLCSQLEIELIPYSQLSPEKQKKAYEASKDGFNLLVEIAKGIFVQTIYYNDNMPEQRIRFTIMHEIGHIVLDHSEHSDLAESEANHFAKYALAPPPLVHKLQIGDYLELAEKFGISNQCAFYSMKNYTNWLKYGSPNLLEHELMLISIFQPVI